jgi:hypothetical protein
MSNGKDEKDDHADDTNDKYDFMKTKVRVIFLKIVMMMMMMMMRMIRMRMMVI